MAQGDFGVACSSGPELKAQGGSTGPDWCGGREEDQVPLISARHDNFMKGY